MMKQNWGGPVRIAFFDDRIEIENPGILLPGMTVDDMKQGISKIRNPVIARFFREANLIEQWGTGVPRIFSQAKEQGLAEPVIKELGMRMRFVVFLAKQIHVKEKQVTEQVTEQVIKFLKHLEKSPLGAREAMKRLGLSHRPTFLYTYLQPALKSGFVEMTQPDSPKSPTQKYRLTAKGRQWM